MCVLLDRHYQYVMFLKITVVENLTELGPLLKLYQIGMEVLFSEKKGTTYKILYHRSAG